MTISQLESYRAVCAELSDIEKELSEYETTVTVQSAVNAPYSLHNVTLTGLPPEPRITALLERQAALKAYRHDVEQFADSIDDSEMRMVIQLKYIRGKRPASWQAIASKLGYRSENTPKRKFHYYMENMHKK